MKPSLSHWKIGTCSNCRAKRAQVRKLGSVQLCLDCAIAYINKMEGRSGLVQPDSPSDQPPAEAA